MNRTAAQFAIAAVMVLTIGIVGGLLIWRPMNITADSKEIVVAIVGALSTGIGVAVHSLFGNSQEIKS